MQEGLYYCMFRRKGEFSTPVKLIIVVVVAVMVLLIYVTVQQDLLSSIKAPVNDFIETAIGGL